VEGRCLVFPESALLDMEVMLPVRLSSTRWPLFPSSLVSSLCHSCNTVNSKQLRQSARHLKDQTGVRRVLWLWYMRTHVPPNGGAEHSTETRLRVRTQNLRVVERQFCTQ
jgi:hypothetical protein